MRHHWHRLTIILAALVAILVAAPSATFAAGEPATTAPQTYHSQSIITLSLGGTTATGRGEGDYDVANAAFHVRSTAEDGTTQVVIEIILLNDRLYIYSSQRQRWEYITIQPQTRQLLVSGPKVVAHPTAAYQPTGQETLDGAAVQRWRAQGDYNVLLPILSQRAFAGSLIQEAITAEAFIGTQDRYLRRTVLTEQGTIRELGPGQRAPEAVTSNIRADYSRFNQPVTITAPEGAVPAPDQAPLPDPQNPLGGIISAAQLGEPRIATLIELTVTPALVAQP